MNYLDRDKSGKTEINKVRERGEFKHCAKAAQDVFKQALLDRDRQIDSVKGEIESVHGSCSWRVMKPVRSLASRLRLWFPLLMALVRFGRALSQGDRVAAGQALAVWWHEQNARYGSLKSRHPIWAELRYGYLIPLSSGTVKKYFKSKLRMYGVVRSPVADGVAMRRPISSLPCYVSEYQADEDFSRLGTDIKALAFYLPQFHTIKENDHWWGEGFTEWTNTRQAEPRFSDHYQPRKPHSDIGYYDLGDTEVLRRQAKLARKHGIYGFCFYHYWFSGKRLLEKPVDLLLQHSEIDIKFCLCWANENWTRTWDGLHRNVLVEQKHLPDDAVNFIVDLRRYLEDPRYIRIDGKPVILIYKPHIIPNAKEVFSTWREWWRENTGGELEIWCNRTDFEDTTCRELTGAIDAVVEFPPHVVPYEVDPDLIAPGAKGHFYDYQNLVADIVGGTERTENPSISFYRSVMLGWDNSPRRKDGWSVWYGFSLEVYYRWLRFVVAYSRSRFPVDRRFVFINAWNEWAEGTYLEPDRKYGYASINTTSRALFDLPFRPAPRVLASSPVAQESPPGSIGVHVHLFFVELAKEVLEYINHIPYPFDLYVTTDTADKATTIKRHFRESGRQERLEVIQTPNIGRDIAPLLVAVGDKLSKYDYVGHFHSKRSTTVSWGDRWRNYLFQNLLGSEEGVRAIFRQFTCEPRLGLLYPPAYPLIAPYADWGGNEQRCRLLLEELGCKIDLPAIPNFPIGNMFWARGAAIKPLLTKTWDYEQFEREEGQIVLTLPHAVERLWPYIAADNDYVAQECLLRVNPSHAAAPDKSRLAIFVHYDPQEAVSDADLFYLRELKRITDDIIVLFNSYLSLKQRNKLKRYATGVIQRQNLGFDFGAWRDGLKKVGWDRVTSYDELILANNSCYGPVFPFEEMFSAMAARPGDFWSVSGFPALTKSSRAEAKLLPQRNIPAHLQSYFMVFTKAVLAAPEFQNFWGNVEDESDVLEVIARYETQLTGKLVAAGFQWGCYLPETYILQERNSANVEFNAVYNLPIEMLLLRSPLVKKKVATYAREQVPLLKYLVAQFGHCPVDGIFPEQDSHYCSTSEI